MIFDDKVATPTSDNSLSVAHRQLNNGSRVLNLLTPNEVASLLRLSTSSIYRLVERRQIKFYRVSGSLRFALADVKQFIEGGVIEPLD